MKDLPKPKVIEYDPKAKMRPAPMSRVRRLVCLMAALAMFYQGYEWIVGPLDAGKPGGRLVIAGLALWFGGFVLLVAALFPGFTLAREHLDRRRHR